MAEATVPQTGEVADGLADAALVVEADVGQAIHATRRARFAELGGLATDHGHLSADTTPLPDAEAAAILNAGPPGAR
ncbi:hypothetical protein GCM10028815_04440 [Mariniluteicoccus flavus]